MTMGNRTLGILRVDVLVQQEGEGGRAEQDCMNDGCREKETQKEEGQNRSNDRA